MPNRIIREGLLTSEKVDKLSANEERFYVRLMLKADDFGRHEANPKLLKSVLFPLKDDLRDADMSRELAACERAGLVRCYEVASKRYVEITNFGQRTRFKSKCPDPPPSDGSQSLDSPQSDDSGRKSAPVGGVFVVGGGGVAEPPPPAFDGLTPTLQHAMSWLEKARQQGSDYTESEAKSAFLSLSACGWKWGKNKVTDWRSALESRIQDGRDRKAKPKARREIAP